MPSLIFLFFDHFTWINLLLTLLCCTFLKHLGNRVCSFKNVFLIFTKVFGFPKVDSNTLIRLCRFLFLHWRPLLSMCFHLYLFFNFLLLFFKNMFEVILDNATIYSMRLELVLIYFIFSKFESENLVKFTSSWQTILKRCS